MDKLLELTAHYPGMTLVTLGPLTNVAVALLRDPSMAARVGRCVVMGGNPCCVGNVTPAAEYNIWCDPEAAEIVLRSGMRVELVGWHLSRGNAVLSEADITAIRAIDTPLARFAIDCNRTASSAYLKQTGEVGISLPDPTALAVALNSGVVTSATDHAVAVECQSELTRGQTLVDQLNVAADDRNADTWKAARASPRTRVIWSIDVAAFKQAVAHALR